MLTVNMTIHDLRKLTLSKVVNDATDSGVEYRYQRVCFDNFCVDVFWDASSDGIIKLEGETDE